MLRLSRLHVRIAATLVLVVAATIGLISLLAYNKFERGLMETASARYEFVLGDVKASIDASLTIGVELSQLANVQGMIDRELKTDADMLFIDVVDQRGRVIFSTDASNLGQSVPVAWTAGDGQSRLQRQDEDDATYMVQPLVNGLDERVGTVVLGYSRASMQAGLAAMRADLGRIALGLVLVFSLGAFTVAGIVLRGPRRRLDALATFFTESRQALDRDGAAAPHVPAVDASLAPALASVAAALATLDAGRALVAEIDGEDA
jgi:sensor histidine kinase regulating citrate/malate metabolism